MTSYQTKDDVCYEPINSEKLVTDRLNLLDNNLAYLHCSLTDLFIRLEILMTPTHINEVEKTEPEEDAPKIAASWMAGEVHRLTLIVQEANSRVRHVERALQI